jgi:molybdopterin-guanine dinucleotide biosynthesis protein A
VATLRALQSAANNSGSESQMTWKALAAASSRMGAPTIDYDRFAARWDSDPMLQQIVDRFDANGVVIKTANKENNLPQGQAQPGQIEKMAKRATKLGK